jgi:molecular chaperone Hsp33
LNTDYVQRFIFESLDIRGRLVCLGPAWQQMTQGRGYPRSIAGLLGETTALTVLLAAARKNQSRLTLQVRGDGLVPLLVADCNADLKIRGMAKVAESYTAQADDSLETLLGAGRIALTLEDDASNQLYQSIVPLEGPNLSVVFANYIEQSEQLSASLQLFAHEKAVGGLLLEKLPNADARDPDGWNRILHLAATLQLDEMCVAHPYDLLTRLFPEEMLRVFELYGVEYDCPFKPDKVHDVLRSLGRAEIASILAQEGVVTIRNEMCNHEYRFDAEMIEAVFAS